MISRGLIEAAFKLVLAGACAAAVVYTLGQFALPTAKLTRQSRVAIQLQLRDTTTGEVLTPRAAVTRPAPAPVPGRVALMLAGAALNGPLLIPKTVLVTLDKNVLRVLGPENVDMFVCISNRECPSSCAGHYEPPSPCCNTSLVCPDYVAECLGESLPREVLKKVIVREFSKQQDRIADCYKEIQAYSREKGIKYNWIIRSRPDLQYHKPIVPPSKLDATMIHARYRMARNLKGLTDDTMSYGWGHGGCGYRLKARKKPGGGQEIRPGTCEICTGLLECDARPTNSCGTGMLVPRSPRRSHRSLSQVAVTIAVFAWRRYGACRNWTSCESCFLIDDQFAMVPRALASIYFSNQSQIMNVPQYQFCTHNCKSCHEYYLSNWIMYNGINVPPWVQAQGLFQLYAVSGHVVVCKQRRAGCCHRTLEMPSRGAAPR